MKRRDTKKGELTKDEISDLIGFRSLLAGLKSPFRSEAARVKAYLDHEEELLEIFSRRYPARRPELWWKYSAPEKRKVIGKSAWISPFPAKVQIHTIIETDAQFLLRTKLFLSHEEAEVVRQAVADSESQRDEIKSSMELVALGHNTPFPGIKAKEPKLLSGPAQKAQP